MVRISVLLVLTTLVLVACSKSSRNSDSSSSEPKAFKAAADTRPLIDLNHKRMKIIFHRDIPIPALTYTGSAMKLENGVSETWDDNELFISDGEYYQQTAEDHRYGLYYGGKVNLETKEKISYDVVTQKIKSNQCYGWWTPTKPDDQSSPEGVYWVIRADDPVIFHAQDTKNDIENSPYGKDRLDFRNDVNSKNRGFGVYGLFGNLLSLSCNGLKNSELTVSHLKTLLGRQVEILIEE